MHRDDRSPVTNEPKWRRYLRMIRANPAGDLDDELRDHLESAVEALIARGWTRDAAQHEAARRFGNVARVRSEVAHLDAKHLTRTDRLAALETFFYDLRHAARGLRRNIAFTLVATLSIALGVAANATIFSVVNVLLLRPIPGSHADRLVRAYSNHHSPFTWDELSWFRDHTHAFDFIIGERYTALAFRSAPGADAERIHASYVTSGYFQALGVQTTLGRALDVDERRDVGAAPVGVLTYPFWQRRFAGDSAVIGRTIVLSEHSVTIVGVAAPEFRSSVLAWTPDVLIPLAVAPILTGHPLNEFGGSFYTIARIKSAIAQSAAQADLRLAMTSLARTDSVRYEGRTVRLDDVRGVNAEERGGVTAASAFLMAIVVAVLLIACANVANLVLGRAAARRTELGVRLAIGASRGRLIRQLLTESLLLAAIGSIVGFGVAWFATRALPAALPPEAGIGGSFFEPDGRVVLFTALLCLATTVLFGLLPALRASAPNLVGLLRGENGGRRSRRGKLVVVQSALCVVLLAVASLFLRSLASSQSIDPGFRADGVIDATIDLGLLGSSTDKSAVFTRIVRDAGAMPGIESASLAAIVPLSGSNMETRVTPTGTVVHDRRDSPLVYFNVIGPKYFATLRTPLLRGRELLATDVMSSPHVAVVNATAAQRLWPNAEAVGKRFHWGGVDGDEYEVVGIAKDANYVMPGESPKPTVYMPYTQFAHPEMTLQLRTSRDAADIRRAVWSLLHDVAPTLPPPPVVRMVDDMAITLLPVRAGAALLGAFGALALVLAAAGIYGVASYSVASRVREMGIRAALGATRPRLVRMVLWENGRRVAIGAIVGMLITVAIGIGLARFLYGVRAVDPLVLGGVAATIAAVAVLASLAPGWRAARVDPVAAIRSE